MPKIFINILYNSGVEKKYEMDMDGKDDLTYEDVKSTVEYLKDEVINEAFKSGTNAFIEFKNKGGESVSVNIKSVAEIRFKIV